MTASAWLTIPSARPVAEVAELVEKWSSLGYGVALWRDEPEPLAGLADIVLSGQYPGYAQAVNALIREVARHPEAEWFIAGGDDTLPDPDHAAEEIAAQCCEHFAGAFGVMQPTGDRWGANEPWARAAFPDAPAYIDRICGSPWIGREFARRMNQGAGPFHPGYHHMFADEELQCVAQRLGVLWQRPDLTHLHYHPMREGPMETQADWQREIYSSAHWQEAKTLFESRKAAGFPGAEPIA